MTDWRAQHKAELRASRRRSLARRLLSLAWFLLAGAYAIFAQQFAGWAAGVLASGLPFAFVSRLFFLGLLLAGFAAMAALGQRQGSPAAALGLPRRAGMGREWALGAALGWTGIVVCVLPVTLMGGLLVTTSTGAAAARSLIPDLLTVLMAALADEVLFRGYPFQRLIEATGPMLAAILLSLLFTAGRGGSLTSPAGTIGTLLFGLLLAMSYLRTRALWLGWGLHFAWNASTAVLFGLPVRGVTRFSPVLSTYMTGPAWLTGGGYGPEGSAIAGLVLLAMFPVLSVLTRDLRHRWAVPEITGAGLPVDVSAMSQRQHAEGMGISVDKPPAVVSAAPSQLVQIAPAAPARVSEPPATPER